jgi:exopolysaccharide production protein ExoQ
MREARRRPSMSMALWIPTALVMILGSRGVSLWLGQGSPENSSGSPSILDELFFAFVIGGSFIIASSRGVKWARVLAANIPLILVYAFFVLSVSWSGDPLASTKRIVKDFGLLFVIALIFSEKEPLEAVRAVFIRAASVLIPLSVVFNHYFPTIARQFAKNGDVSLVGVTEQKNTLGEMVFVFCTILFWDFLERNPKRAKRFWAKFPWDQLILFVMGLFLLYQSKSKTSLLCLLICAVLSARSGWFASKMISNVAFFAAFSTPFLLFFSQQFSAIIEPIVESLGRNMTFTGRTNIWDQITLHTVNPLIGYGYWNFWKSPGGLAISDVVQWDVPNAHNGYLDIYLDGGFVALILLCCYIFAYGRRMIKQSHNGRFQLVRLGFFAAAIVHNLSESSLFRMGLLWFATLLVTVEFPRMKRAVKKVPPTHQDVAVASPRRDPVLETVHRRAFR